MFSGTTADFGRPERSESISLFSRILIKALFCLNSIFLHQEKCLINTKFLSIHCFENYKTGVTKTTAVSKLTVRMS